MTDTEIIIAVAKLDGLEVKLKHFPATTNWETGETSKAIDLFVCTDGSFCPDYLTSRDAIVPVIEKHCASGMTEAAEIANNLRKDLYGNCAEAILVAKDAKTSL